MGFIKSTILNFGIYKKEEFVGNWGVSYIKLFLNLQINRIRSFYLFFFLKSILKQGPVHNSDAV